MVDGKRQDEESMVPSAALGAGFGRWQQQVPRLAPSFDFAQDRLVQSALARDDTAPDFA